MGPESLFNPSEPSQSTGTKRLSALPDVDRETKRLCTQPIQISSEVAAPELSYGHNSCGGFGIESGPQCGDAAMWYSIDPGIEWSNAMPPDVSGGLELTHNPQAAESCSFILDPVSAQMVEMNMRSVPQTGFLFETQESSNTMDLHHSFDASEDVNPGLELNHDPNFRYNGNLLDGLMPPGPSCLPFAGPLIDSASTWFDITTEPEKCYALEPWEPFASSGLDTIGTAPEDEKMLITSRQETTSVGTGDPFGLYSCSQPSLSKMTSKSFVANPNQTDICFGVIVANVASSWTGSQGTKVTPVTVRPFGDVMKLSFQDSKKYAGILNLPALCKLQEDFTIDYTANMTASESRRGQRTATEKATTATPPVHDCSVRVIIHGVKSEKNSVCELLSDSGLYLQHPSAAELYRRVEYWNPHYLLRPGSQMPKLEDLSISLDVNTVTTVNTMEETQKSRIMQIFNSDSGLTGSLNPTFSPRLQSTLKHHQIIALAMMTEKECGIVDNGQFPSLWNFSSSPESTVQYHHKVTGICQNIPIPVYGGILADEMGLGKTLSLLALVCSSLDSLADQESSPDDGMSRATLIVTPKSTIPGWQRQVERHIYAGQIRLAVYHGANRRRLLSNFWKSDIVLTTYETLRLDWAATGPLFSGTWRRLVLDEAHHIRNRSSQLFKAASAISSKSRWCLTGTPIHNSLDDYGALLSFIRVPLLMEKSQFDFWIMSPITQKRPDCFGKLGDLIRATCIRRTKYMIQDSLKLPRRTERVEEIELHQADLALYHFFREKTAKIAAGLAGRDENTPRSSEGKGTNILTLINFLRRICNHGEELLPLSALEAWRSKNITSVDWQMMQSCNKICGSCGSVIEEVDLLSGDSQEFSCRHSICATCSSRRENTPTDEVGKCPKCAATRVTSGNLSGLSKPPIRLSAKVEALIRNLDAEQTIEQHEHKALPIKSVIFSHWTKMLDLISPALRQNGFRFQRIDGQSSLQQRSMAIQQFNDDPACTVMLASVGSAGEGVDLTAANHVHVVEPHWSPMAEAQAVDRVHRIGQNREVVVTRYIVGNTIETYIQWVQQDKLRLINRSLDSAEALQSDVDDARWKALQRVLDASEQ